VQGIAHAFNGSLQQAEAFLALGFRLGFGGAMTFDGAQQLRRLAAGLPDSALVLETDAPDIPAAVALRDRGAPRGRRAHGRNEPAELPRIAAALAALRGTTPETLAAQSAPTRRRRCPAGRASRRRAGDSAMRRGTRRRRTSRRRWAPRGGRWRSVRTAPASRIRNRVRACARACVCVRVALASASASHRLEACTARRAVGRRRQGRRRACERLQRRARAGGAPRRPRR
jgi:hypothetical protein